MVSQERFTNEGIAMQVLSVLDGLEHPSKMSMPKSVPQSVGGLGSSQRDDLSQSVAVFTEAASEAAFLNSETNSLKRTPKKERWETCAISSYDNVNRNVLTNGVTNDACFPGMSVCLSDVGPPSYLHAASLFHGTVAAQAPMHNHSAEPSWYDANVQGMSGCWGQTN